MWNYLEKKTQYDNLCGKKKVKVQNGVVWRTLHRETNLVQNSSGALFGGPQKAGGELPSPPKEKNSNKTEARPGTEG